MKRLILDSSDLPIIGETSARKKWVNKTGLKIYVLIKARV